MLRFDDAAGASWEAVVGRESWGAFFAIFIPRGEGDVRQAMLSASSYEEATRELDALEPGELLDLFQRSQPKTIG